MVVHVPVLSDVFDDVVVRNVLRILFDRCPVVEGVPHVPPEHTVRAVLHERVVDVLVEGYLPWSPTRIRPIST